MQNNAFFNVQKVLQSALHYKTFLSFSFLFPLMPLMEILPTSMVGQVLALIGQLFK